MFQHFLFTSKLVLGVLSLFSLVDSNSRNRMHRLCDEVEFYKPYVEIFGQRGSNPLFQLHSPGFVDLRNQFGVLLCVNGPAFLYNEEIERHNLTSQVHLLNVFSVPNATAVKFYTHECFLINRLVKGGGVTQVSLPTAPSSPSVPVVYPNPSGIPAFYQDKDKNRAQAAAAAAYHGSIRQGSNRVSNLLNKNSSVDGVKAFGITLFGAHGDYRKASLFLFPEKKFGNNDHQLVIESSIITIGRNEWKLHDNFTNSSITIQPGQQNPDEVCIRPQGDDVFDKNFQRGHRKDEYGAWTRMPHPDDSGKKRPGTANATTTPVVDKAGPPTKPNATKEEKTGRFINPTLMGNGSIIIHSSNGLQTVHMIDPQATTDEDGVQLQNGGGVKYPFDFPEDLDPTIEKMHKNIVTPVTNCHPLPIQTEYCIKPSGAAVETCKIITAALELEPKDLSATQKDLVWKKDILKLFRDTFTQICPQVSENAISSVSTIFLEMYILETHKNNATLSQVRTSDWDNLEMELEHCRNDSTPLEFKEGTATQEAVSSGVPSNYQVPNVYVSVGDFVADNASAKITVPTPEASTTPETPKLKRNVVVRRYDGSDSAIFHYEEAADADFEFNIVIDFQWKVFATVMGYCNKFYASKRTSVLSKMMEKLLDDFLAINQKSWVDPVSNDIYGYIMGEGQDSLGDCLEGAYVHSDSVEFRPVRPLAINGGKNSNYFTKIPPNFL